MQEDTQYTHIYIRTSNRHKQQTHMHINNKQIICNVCDVLVIKFCAGMF